MKPYDIGLIVGRFQHFHIGHRSLVENAYKLCDRVLILVGSAQESGTLRNPYLPSTRIDVIREIYGKDNQNLLVKELNDLTNENDITVFKHNHGFNLNSFACLFKVGDILIYYSGDSKTIDEKVLKIFRGKDPDYTNTPITEFCQDTTKYINDAHMNIHDLANIFSKKERKRVTLMHFDDDETIKIAKKYGFNIANK